VFVISAFILGYIGFSKYYAVRGESKSFFDLTYKALQLFTLESGSVKGPINWELESARWICPIIAAYTVLSALGFIFREQLQALRLRLIKDHVIIYGTGQRTHLLARKILENEYRIVLVEHNDRESSTGKNHIRGIIELTGDARDEKFLHRIRIQKSKYLILFCEDDGINIEIAVNARNFVREFSSDTITCIVHIVDPQLCYLLREKEVGTETTDTFRLEFFDIFDSGARYLLKEFPPFKIPRGFDNSLPHIAIIGLGQMGESLLLHILKMWKESSLAAKEKLRITLVDKVGEQRKETLDLHYPQLNKICDISTLQMSIESPAFRRADFLFNSHKMCDVTSIYICLDDDSLGLSTALILQKRLQENPVPIIIRMAHESGLATLLGEKSEEERYATLSAFGLLDKTCEPELLIGGINETIARAIHEQYVETQYTKGITPDTNPSMVPWDELTEKLKESNRLVADDIIIKLKNINCGITPLNDWGTTYFAFTSEEIELMAEMEHKRWMSERSDAGWKYAAGEKNVKKKTSPYLVNWADLSEDIKEIDRNIVRRIPEFLAKVDLQVYRK
jgi:hypothetical protein